jgi:hypothetical protein
VANALPRWTLRSFRRLWLASKYSTGLYVDSTRPARTIAHSQFAKSSHNRRQLAYCSLPRLLSRYDIETTSCELAWLMLTHKFALLGSLANLYANYPPCLPTLVVTVFNMKIAIICVPFLVSALLGTVVAQSELRHVRDLTSCNNARPCSTNRNTRCNPVCSYGKCSYSACQGDGTVDSCTAACTRSSTSFGFACTTKGCPQPNPRKPNACYAVCDTTSGTNKCTYYVCPEATKPSVSSCAATCSPTRMCGTSSCPDPTTLSSRACTATCTKNSRTNKFGCGAQA